MEPSKSPIWAAAIEAAVGVWNAQFTPPNAPTAPKAQGV